VTDLIKKISLLADTDPEKILIFLMGVKGVHDLNLVTDFEFISPLDSRTSGSIMQNLRVHLGNVSRTHQQISKLNTRKRAPSAHRVHANLEPTREL
jgi:hypothetical protein